MISGLSAFPLTPLRDQELDEDAFVGIVDRLAHSGVDSITVLGSTGSYAYLSREERRRALETAAAHVGTVPFYAGIGGLRTAHVLAHAEDAQAVGAQAVLLAPMTYQPLTDDDVFGLYEDVSKSISVPLIVYDNPGTTHVTFSLDLYARIAALPHVSSIKIPGVPEGDDAARQRINEIRSVIPEMVSIGVSGDATAARGMNAGADAWYSVIAGTLPGLAVDLVRAAKNGKASQANAISAHLQPLWNLFAVHGSYRVVAVIAEELGLVGPQPLPLPIRGLKPAERRKVMDVLGALGLISAE